MVTEKKRLPQAQKKEIEAKARESASYYRNHWGLGNQPVSDVFDLLARRGILLLRYPSGCEGLQAYISKHQEDVVVFINSDMPLGRQIFSAGHELAHYVSGDLNEDFFIACNPGDSGATDPKEVFADAFAGEFLMPSESVCEVFRQKVKRLKFVTVYDIINMQYTFKVSYLAMLHAPLRNKLIEGRTFGALKRFSLVENADRLRQAIVACGYSTDLIEKTQPQIPPEFLTALRKNFEDGLVSYRKVASLLEIWGKHPEEMGFTYDHDF